MKVGHLLLDEQRLPWIVIQNQEHSDYCVLLEGRIHSERRVKVKKRWIIDPEEMEDRIGWFSQRFETKEAKEEFIKKHNAEIEEERRKKRENSSYTRETIHPLKAIAAYAAGFLIAFLAILGIFGIVFYNVPFELFLLCSFAAVFLLS